MKSFIAAALAGISFIGLASAAQADDGFTINPRGRAYLDWASVTEKYPGSDTTYSDAEFRTARLGVYGQFTKDWKYVAEFDFAPDETPTAKDVKITGKIADGWSLVLGNQKTPNSMEELTSSRYTSFMERAAITDLVDLKRQFGAAVVHKGHDGSFSAGIYTDNLADAISDGQALITSETAFAVRGTYALINEKHRKLHLGVSFRQREMQDGTNIRYRARPDAHLAARNFSVSNQGDSATLVGVEAAYIQGPFYVQAEFMNENAVDTANGGYVQAGWFLTGEQRSYSAGSGTFGRTKPSHPFGVDGGMGAVELAVRYDWSKVNGTLGGNMRNWTLGANWYLAPKIRMMANVAFSNVDGAAAVFGEGDTTTFQVRGQIDF